MSVFDKYYDHLAWFEMQKKEKEKEKKFLQNKLTQDFIKKESRTLGGRISVSGYVGLMKMISRM